MISEAHLRAGTDIGGEAAPRGVADLGAGALNGLLGWFLLRTGRRLNSKTLEADGHHLLSDAITSAAALVALGRSNREIAESLVVSERTAATHVSNILSKLHLANRTQAALYALKEGLATLDEHGNIA